MTETAVLPVTKDLGPSKTGFRRNRNRPAVPRPKPKYKNARDGEIGQMVKLYKPEKVNDELFHVQMKPSDPDFPFDFPILKFNLSVPKNYPKSAPFIHVTNTEIPVGYSANIDLGFKNEIAEPKLGKSRLLDMLLDLDKHLEEFLSREKQETFKIVRKRTVKPGTSTTNKPVFNFHQQLFIPDHVAKKRSSQLSLLEKRLGDDIKKLSSSANGDTYIIYVSRDSPSDFLISEMSVGFKAHIFIPKDYPLTGCSLDVPISDVMARNVEKNFNSHASNYRATWTLLSLINFLSCKLEELTLAPESYEEGAKAREGDKQTTKEGVESEQSDKLAEKLEIIDFSAETPAQTCDVSDLNPQISDETPDNSHHTLIRRGTELSFILDEFVNIGYLDCHSLNLQIECQRCKTVNDCTGVLSAAYGKISKPAYSECKKCKLELAVSFRKDIFHSGSRIVGYLDLSGCQVVDYLPSLFHLTCEKCSKTREKPMRIPLGRKISEKCHECHESMSLKVDMFELRQMELKGMKLGRKSDKPDKLHVQLGSSLPDNGTCKHYKKSMRWFRFSCCSKIFACDRCHGESDHPCEHASRMICGKCSKEQPISSECCLCHLSFDTSRHSAFWEGGRGTRDRSKMSRKDPRKHKRTQLEKARDKVNGKKKEEKE